MKHQVVSESGLPASSVVRAVLQYTNCGSRKVDLRALGYPTPIFLSSTPGPRGCCEWRR